MKGMGRSRSWNGTLWIAVAVLLLATAVVRADDGSPVRPRPVLWSGLSDSPASVGVGEPGFRLGLTPMDGTLSNNTWPLSTLDHWLDKTIPVDVREQFVGSVPAEGFILGADSRHGVQLGIGSLDVGFGLRTEGSVTLGRDVLQLALLGNELNRPYDLAGNGMDVLAYGDTSVAYSLSLGPSARLGVRYHHLFSGTYLRVSVAGDGEFVYTEDEAGAEADVAVQYVHAGLAGPSGSGAAWDVGVDVALGDTLAAGVALLDMGHLQWSEAVRGTCTWSLAVGEFGEDLDAENEGCSETTLDEWTRSLPGRWQLALGWQPVPAWHVGAAYTGRLSDGGGDVRCRECGGLEATVVWQGVKFLQLGLGGTFAGGEAPLISGGAALRLGPVQLRVRLHDMSGLFGTAAAKTAGFGLDMGIVF